MHISWFICLFLFFFQYLFLVLITQFGLFFWLFWHSLPRWKQSRSSALFLDRSLIFFLIYSFWIFFILVSGQSINELQLSLFSTCFGFMMQSQLFLKFSLVFFFNHFHLLTVFLVHLDVRWRITHKQLLVNLYPIIQSRKLPIEIRMSVLLLPQFHSS